MSFCPLCQNKNNCDVSAGSNCWCAASKVPTELINSVPKEQQGKACICKQCIEKYQLDQVSSSLFKAAK